MEEYKHHIFYKKKEGEFSITEIKEILRDAFSKCYEWRVDHLPTWQREKINMPFEEILKYVKYKPHFVIIHRRGYNNPYYLEIGFSTLGEPKKLKSTKVNFKGSLFLWLNLNEEWLEHFKQNYNLIER